MLKSAPVNQFDAIVVGAGFGGLRALYELRNLGLSVRVLEAADDVGGVWNWNRYPGAHTDSESSCYCFGFSRELIDEWEWTKRYPGQPEVLGYLQFAADKLDMRKDIKFNARVNSATYDEDRNRWKITVEGGEEFVCTFFIIAGGGLSAPYEPPFPGREDFRGQQLQTSRWPKEPVDFVGKRVAIIGAGSTATQLLPIVAQVADQVTLFQRTPNYVLPGRNYALHELERQAMRKNFDKNWALCEDQFFAFPLVGPNRVATDYSPEEQEKVFDAGWETGGFRFFFESFDDIYVNQHSNDAAAEFVRKKIRTIVKDPKTAEALCPYDYPIGSKRPPVSMFYYETFNRENVALVDVRKDPIESITRNGIKTVAGEREFDIIIYALGFDGVTGSITRINICGRGGKSIAEKWNNGAAAYLGIAVDEFPNMFTITGPQTAFANIPVVIDKVVTWIGKAIDYARMHGADRVEVRRDAVDAWDRHMSELLNATILGQGTTVNSWFLGANIPGKAHKVLFHFGGAQLYFQELRDSVDGGFEEFELTKAARGVAQHA